MSKRELVLQRREERRALRVERRAARKAVRRGKRGDQTRLQYLMKNFRLSLTFRIALSYSWQLARTTLLAILVMTVIFAGTVLADFESDVDRLCDGAIPPEGVYTQLELQDRAIAAQLVDVPFAGSPLPFLRYRIISLDLLGDETDLVAEAAHVSGQTLRLEIDLHQPVTTWCWLCGAVVLIDLIRMATFLRRREKLCHSVLAPINDITEMATTLSASNLSNRINIAGTKNELKDLAAVINSMLDRIERSYNSQKQFVSDASHELRTPIAVIQGYVNMLQRRIIF